MQKAPLRQASFVLERRPVVTAPVDFGQFEVLTFDCYGTLIDWETGLLAGLREALGPAADAIADDDLLAAFAVHEAGLEAGPYLRYREVLARSLDGVARDIGLDVAPGAAAAFGGSVVDWPAFADSAAALADLQRGFRLGVITNCDDDLFAASNRRLGVDVRLDRHRGAGRRLQTVRRNFHVALQRIGVARERILHVAQSLFHDHVPAQRLG